MTMRHAIPKATGPSLAGAARQVMKRVEVESRKGGRHE